MIKTSHLFRRSSVALADILANSVAVILILLIATLDVERKNAQDELTQNANITTLLSRQIASNVVFNDLPTSPPAYLHDYNACSIAHDCDPSRYPIIEVYDNYVRILSKNSTNQKFYRNELLKQKNALDRYIGALSTEERDNIRFDIHGVGQYYLILSILSEHKIRPRHWHYLGEDAPQINFDQLANEQSFGTQESELDNDDKTNAGNEKSELMSEVNSQNQNDILNGQIGQMTLNSVKYDSLLPNDEGYKIDESGIEQNLLDMQQYMGAFEEQLLKLMEIGINGNVSSSDSGNYQSTIRIPNLKNGLGAVNINDEILSLEKYRIYLLANLFNILTHAANEQTFDLSKLAKNKLKLAINKDISKHQYYQIIKKLDAQLNKKQAQNNQLREIKYSPQLTNNQLIITVNEAVPKIDIALIEKENWLQQIQNKPNLKIDYLLRLYPTLFKGEFLKSTDNMTILVSPQEFNNPIPRWLPIAAFDYRLENISLGFIYAGVKNNSLIIDTNINQVKLNNRYLAKVKINPNQRYDYNYSSIMWFLALVMIILLLTKPWIKYTNKANL